MLGLAADGGTAGAEVEGIKPNDGADVCGLGRFKGSLGGGGGGGGVVVWSDDAVGVSGRGGNDGARRTGYGDS